MILQKEIRKFSKEWNIPQDTVDKDYVLGHFLSEIYQHFEDKIIFKGGTCLRKCYFPDYRFSEDLDFTARSKTFTLKNKSLKDICKNVENHSNILAIPEKIKQLEHEDRKMGYQVKLKYWGANHSKSQQPTPSNRWVTKIKLEISLREKLILTPNYREIYHPYSDSLSRSEPIPCYPLNEIVSEKIRALIQRSYTAPRDFYDLYQLTNNLDKHAWIKIKELLIKKMKHKGIEYRGPDQFVDNKTITHVRKAWETSIAHQVDSSNMPSPSVIINEVKERIEEYL